MDPETETRAGSSSTDLTERLRARDPGALASFLGSWSGGVDRYCRTVCEPHLVADAVEVTFADFLEKVDSHPIEDSHLESALLRSARLTAAEAARIDWDEPGPLEGDESASFDCELTPLFLAGSPSVPASVNAITRMDEHVRACPRCRASADRFEAAEKAFPGSKDADIPEQVLEALSERFSIPVEPEPAPEPEALSGTAIEGFPVASVDGEDADGVAFCTALGEQGERVALRLAPADRDADFTARFLRDAQLLAGLEHPSLPSVVAVGEVPSGAYVVIEELKGRSLTSVVEQGLSTERTIRMLGEVADALDTAHAAGLLHRQLRPENVVVGAWLIVRPLLVNFALGRAREVVLNGDQTPYLAPEELRGDAVGPAADRYALACMLFELLIGRPPFGERQDAAARGHLTQPPPRASEARPDLPTALDAVFERALSKSPDERFASAAELASEVYRAMFGPPPTPSEPTAPEPTAAEPPATQPPEPSHPSAPDGGPEADAPDSLADADRPEDPDAALGITEDPEDRDREAFAVAPSEGSPPEAGPPPDVAESRRAGTRTRAGLIAAAGVAAVGAVAAVVALAGGDASDEDRSSAPARNAPAGERGRQTSVTPGRPPSPPMMIAGTRATDYDPNGGNGELPEKVGALTDADVETAWQTEDYPRGTFGRGVGAYVSLPQAQRLREIVIRTTTPGWDAEIYGASAGPPPALPAGGWRKLGSRSEMRGVERIQLLTDGEPVRYCLVWITKLPAPGFVSIADIRVFR